MLAERRILAKQDLETYLSIANIPIHPRVDKVPTYTASWAGGSENCAPSRIFSVKGARFTVKSARSTILSRLFPVHRTSLASVDARQQDFSIRTRDQVKLSHDKPSRPTSTTLPGCRTDNGLHI